MRLVSLAVVAALVVSGCGARQATRAPSAAPPAPPTSTRFDARWMGLTPDRPPGWEELNRRITADFQQFSLRPIDDTEYRYGCNGCAPWTVDVTAYAPGAFDPTEARTGLPVTVNVAGDGFLVENPDVHAATLSWRYADDTWATVRAMTRATTQRERMLELARALKPAQRTPIRLPMSVANLPPHMPLAEIDVDTSALADDALDYGTRFTFAPCAGTANGATSDCRAGADTLSVHVWPADDRAPSGSRERRTVPLVVDGRDGYYDELTHEVAVRIPPDVLVDFELAGPSYRGDRRAGFERIFAGLTWAPDPGDEATWPAVTDWAR